MKPGAQPLPASPALLVSDLPPIGSRDEENGILCTPVPGLQLKSGDVGHTIGSPHIASPMLATWTPRLAFGDLQHGPDAKEEARLRSLRGSALLSQWGGRPARSDVLASAVAQLPILPLSMVPLPQAAQASYLLSMPYNVHLEAGAAAGAGGYVLLPLTALGASGVVPQASVPVAMPPAVAEKHPMQMVAVEAAPSGEGSGADAVAEAARGRLASPETGATDAAACTLAELAPTAGAGSNRAAPAAGAGASRPAGSPARRSRSMSVEQPSVVPTPEKGPREQEASSEHLTLEFLEENGYFDMPIQQAASQLGVGVTTLKKVCRVHSIGRWPFRKRSSLNRLIEKTREYFAHDPVQLAEALAQLEAQRSVLRSQQGEDIPDQVKRYRQSIFKLDYKVKRIVKERRTHRGAAAAALAANDKAHTMRQLGVGTPANHIIGLLCGDGHEGRVKAEHEEMDYEEEEEEEEEAEAE